MALDHHELFSYSADPLMVLLLEKKKRILLRLDSILLVSCLDTHTRLLFTCEWKIHAVLFSCLNPNHSPSCLALCCRCWLSSEGGEHHSRQLVNRGSGARRTSSFPGFVLNTVAHIQKYWNIGLLLSTESSAFWLVMTTVLLPSSVGQLIIKQIKISIMPLLYELFWAITKSSVIFTNSAPTMYVYWGVKVCFTFCRFRLPSSVWRCLQNRFVLIRNHFYPHSFHLTFAYDLCLHSRHTHSVLCICLMYLVFLSLSSPFSCSSLSTFCLII